MLISQAFKVVMKVKSDSGGVVAGSRPMPASEASIAIRRKPLAAFKRMRISHAAPFTDEIESGKVVANLSSRLEAQFRQ